MGLGKCHRCGGKVRRGSAALDHWARTLRNSRRRCCASCGERWSVKQTFRASPFYAVLLAGFSLATTGALLAGAFFVLSATAGQ